MFEDLKLNKMDTGKAEKYMESNEKEFGAIGYLSSDKFEFDILDNKIFFSQYERSPTLKPLGLNCFEKLEHLAVAVDMNKQILAQIEYLLRKIPINESLNIDLNLIVKNILHVSSCITGKFYNSNVIVMHGRSPLASLGLVAQILCAFPEVIIESTPETAVLCHLFVSLCRKVGLNVSLVIVEMSEPNAFDLAEMKELEPCCVGVVAERADVDSAVDAFIASTTKTPWKIRRILVQESVIDRLKEAFAWKAERNPSAKNIGEVKSNCSAAYHINNKLFVHEYTGVQLDDCVLIEAYRTVKELLSLCAAYEPIAVSLWCSDISQANEIAHGIDSTIVWINDYASFHGPTKSSQAFYSIVDVKFIEKALQSIVNVKEVLTARDEWIKLSLDARRSRLSEFVKEFTVKETDFLKEFDRGDFFKVDNGRLCMGFELLETGFDINIDKYIDWDSVLSGSVTIILKVTDNEDFCRSIRASRAPLFFGSNGDYSGDFSRFYSYKVKVVHTNFGTVFAN